MPPVIYGGPRSFQLGERPYAVLAAPTDAVVCSTIRRSAGRKGL